MFLTWCKICFKKSLYSEDVFDKIRNANSFEKLMSDLCIYTGTCKIFHMFPDKKLQNFEFFEENNKSGQREISQIIYNDFKFNCFKIKGS